MNVLNIFDQRIGAIFAAGAPGTRPPFSFKRLAKRAVREMEDETFVIDGVDTAPALYTVLVSQANDIVMRPMYVDITNEISQLIEAQAKKRGYTFVGKPLVRFMVDPALRGGRFSVFAENIDPRTLARLRDEENVYLGVTPPHEIYVEQSFIPSPIPVHEEEPMPVAQEVSFVQDEIENIPMEEPELAPEPVPEFEPEPVPVAVPDPDPIFEPEPMPEPVLEPEPEFEPIANKIDEPLYPETQDEVVAGVSEPEPDPFTVIPEDYVSQISEPKEEEENAPVPRHAAHAAPAAPSKPVCSLLDLESGRTYRVTSTSAIIGRENIAGGVVIKDPNASRRHAELTFDGARWAVRDLGSTNGTLVNDADVPEAYLRDGDVLTIGLTNLEFRAG